MNKIRKFINLGKDLKKSTFQEEREMSYIKVELKKAWIIVKLITKMTFTKKELRKSTKNTIRE